MYRKILTFTNEAGDKQRVYFKDGICVTPATLDMVLQGGYTWESIKKSGDTSPLERRKQRARKHYGNVEIPEEFAGQQNPPKAVAKEPVLDSEGKTVAPKRGKKSSITPETIENVRKAASEGMTLRQAETALGMPYSTLAFIAKKQNIAFTPGKKGRQKQEAALVEAPAPVAVNA